ncbi:MAG: hypothetical protein ACT4O1_04585 [Gemmatimonadota bacterium]
MSPGDPVDALRRTKLGHTKAEFGQILGALGFEFDRNGTHGAIYKSKELALHPDKSLALRYSWMTVPNSCEREEYVAKEVIRRAEILAAYRAQQGSQT